MAGEKMFRLSQVARKLNVGTATITEHLATKGFEIENKPNTKISMEQFNMLAKEFKSSALDKEEASGLRIGKKHAESFVIDSESVNEEVKTDQKEEEFLIKNISSSDAIKEEEEIEKIQTSSPKLQGFKVVGKIDLAQKKKEEAKDEQEKPGEPVKQQQKSQEEPKEKASNKEKTEESAPPPEEKVDRTIQAKADTLKGLTVLGKINLPDAKKKEKPVASSDNADKKKRKRPRKRITIKKDQEQQGQQQGSQSKSNQNRSDNRPNKKGKRQQTTNKKEEISDKQIQDQIKATLARLSNTNKGTTGAKYRREKRSAIANAQKNEQLKEQESQKVLKVTEFISASDLASLLNISVNDVISTCMGMGMFVSINQRLDAESITFIADEFGYNVEFISAEDEVVIEEEVDQEENLSERAPIVTIMGHVDHGKTSLLDYIRNSKVTEAEAGGITQHIGAYDVTTESGKRIAFLDTPGHEAFTAMRARGAKITDIVIVVVAADDSVMPQTKEALNHAKVAGVPIVIAINKVDKPQANPDKIREELSGINILVEDWGGKYQCQEISAKTGLGINDLLEKVLLEAELLELKANADKNGVGTVIEASLDKGRGYLTTVMVQTGQINIGDVILAGQYFGKIKAMFDHRGQRIKHAGPSTPIQLLGLPGAPQAGDRFNIMGSEKEAREIANKREQIQREQNLRTKKHITLDEIGRRLAIGSFKELNIIVKGDVDGSIEALSDSLLKLSTEEVQINIIHKAVGQISESDVLLASASDAVIIGFQVRPSASARKLAEKEEIEIRLYSIIYNAINEIKDAMEGMLVPVTEEVIVGNAEVRNVFKISRIGTVAGCYVTDGVIKRNNQSRLIREGIVIYTGDIHQLKRFKDDVNEVKTGFECGLSIKNFNDIKVGDIVESFEEQEIKRKL